MSFRNSVMPDWNLPEVDGYFGNQSRASSNAGHANNSSHDRTANAGFISATQLKHNILSKDVRKEEIKLKLTRLFHPVVLGFGLQVVFLLILSFLYPGSFWASKDSGVYYYLGFNYFYNVGMSLWNVLLSIQAIKLALFTFAVMFLVATCLYGADQFPESTHEQILRYSTPRFLMKPIAFGLLSLLHCNIFLGIFEDRYSMMQIVVPGATTNDDKTYFRADILVIRLSAFLSGILFFVYVFLNNGFRLSFPTTQAKLLTYSMLDAIELSKVIRGSMPVVFVVWLTCLFFGPLLYSPLYNIFHIRTYVEEFATRLIMFLEVGFLFRALVWTCMSRISLQCYLAMVNCCLTEIINLPIEQPPNNNQCLILSEGMKCDNDYIKYLSFYEFRMKSDSGHPDSMVFFNITHPGNHPVNWKGVFNASCDVIISTTTSIIELLKTLNIPAHTLQSNLQPYVLSRLREEGKIPQSSSDTNGTSAPIRPANMRDLTSMQNKPESSAQSVPVEVPREYNSINDLVLALWDDFWNYLCEIFSLQTLNNVLFLGKLDRKIPEKQLSNLLGDLRPVNWGMGGCLKVIFNGLVVDSRGILHQDIKPFVLRVLEFHDTLTALEFYLSYALDKEQGIDRNVLLKFKQILGRTITTTVFILTKFHNELEDCYNILNIDEEVQYRMADIASANQSP